MAIPYAEWTEEQKARSRASAAAWKAAHPGASAARAREWNKAHPERHLRHVVDSWNRLTADERLARRRASWRKKTYGLTAEEFERMRADQGDRCAACGGEWTRGHPHVDHDHATGQVRGLLCVPCNITAGFLESEERRAVVQAYLNRKRG